MVHSVPSFATNRECQPPATAATTLLATLTGRFASAGLPLPKEP